MLDLLGLTDYRVRVGLRDPASNKYVGTDENWESEGRDRDTTSLPGCQNGLVEAVAAATRALGLRHGPVHAECRVSGGEVYVLEVAARPIGGLCSKALRFRTPAGSVACRHRP